MEAIYKREMQSYFKSLVAYCVVAFFGGLAALYFWMVNISGRSTSFASTLDQLTTFLVFFIPVLTMKLFADDKKNGTEVLLRTAPVKTIEIVMGKFLAAASIFIVMVAETVFYPFIMSFFINEDGVFPFTTTLSGYIAFILLGLAYVAVGTLASSITDSQPVAALVGVIILIFFMFMELIGSSIGGVIGSILTWVSLPARYSAFSDGLFDISAAFYFVSFTATVLAITTMLIERKRWN